MLYLVHNVLVIIPAAVPLPSHLFSPFSTIPTSTLNQSKLDAYPGTYPLHQPCFKNNDTISLRSIVDAGFGGSTTRHRGPHSCPCTHPWAAWLQEPTSYEVDVPKEIISLGCRSHECQRSCSTFVATRRGSSTSECQICSFKRYIQ